ncbi:phage holin [Salinicoccus sesuvii]|uniref:Phage holin n=1 Tax=Salinicoccus sesuvii TaxID=868281 RepID=A0ABV7N3R8_9STAP
MSEEKFMEVSSRPAWMMLALLIIGFLNQALILLGYSPLPFSEGELETLLVTGYNITVGLIVWYKNMPTSKEGRIGTAVTRQLKKDKGIQ